MPVSSIADHAPDGKTILGSIRDMELHVPISASIFKWLPKCIVESISAMYLNNKTALALLLVLSTMPWVRNDTYKWKGLIN